MTFPLRSILHKPELSGRLAKWAIELSEHDITYQPRTAIKLQVLADFLSDFTAKIVSEAERGTAITSTKVHDQWALYTDGASNASGFGPGLVLEVPTGEMVFQSVQCPNMTNNEYEYETVIAGLKLAFKRAQRVILQCDSQLVINQVIGNFQIKEQQLQKYQAKICKLLPEFDKCQLDQIPRAQNIKADGLAKLAAATKSITGEGDVVTLLHSSLDQIEVRSINLTWYWRNRIISYLQDGVLPPDKKDAKKLRMQAARYSVVNNDLYKRTFGGPLAKCLGPNQTRRVPEDVHEGHYGANTSNRALVRCLIQAGYYWPTLKKEAANFVKRCEQCQRYAPMIHQEGETPSFSQLALAFHQMGNGHRRTPTSGTRNQLRQGPWFIGKKTAEFFEKWHINSVFSTPYLPASNGQVVSSNKTILNIMKKKLENANGLWSEVLSEVLLAYCTMPKTSTWETPHSLVYGTDAIIPVEVGERSLRYSNDSGPRKNENRRQDLDEVEEIRDMAYIRMIAQKQQAEQYYNQKAKIRPLKIGDYVLKAKTQANKDP
ncbi:PREDICTED: uncharacterized protein LOC109216473 [Nicotiana attenuata]|uniref:uncharacterized protein LOC109216473 n=1 Tax=Nicotiana attenuata TaxID=49451 RepID=UPI00090537A6|nr:PREDICTED: uncharacterized protein LOC109216473 [Nicotiana attenuata]